MAASLNFPPGPKAGILGLEFVNQMKTDALKTAMQLKSEFGDFVYIRFAPYHWFMLNHPDQVKEILLTRAKSFGKTDMFKRVIRSVDGNGLVVSEGDFWLRQRRTINPAFNHTSVASYAKTIQEETERYIERWEPGMKLDLADEMTKLTLTVAARSFFSVDVSENAKEFGDAVTVLTKAMLSEFYEIFPVPEWFPLPSKMAKRKAIATLEKLIYQSIATHKQNNDQTADVLSMLLRARDPEDNTVGMSDRQIRDEAMTLFNAGHDTTAAALSWAWYLLLINPEVYDQLVSHTIPTSPDGGSSLALQIAKETLRLYPPAWTLPRQSLEDTVIGGYNIPRGSMINFFPYVIQRDDRFFEQPEVFQPARFSEENEHKLVPFSYFPFGAGPRACIGKEMALTEMSVILTTVSKKFRFELVPGQNIQPAPLISLEQKTGVKAIVKEIAQNRN